MDNNEYIKLKNDIIEHLNSICKDDRVRYHIIPTAEIAVELAKKYDADIQVVEIAALLHDVTKINGERRTHHITGAEFAENFLKNYNIEENKVKQISNCILKHRGSVEFPRDTLEEKIIVTADCVAQIKHPLTLFYSWYGVRQCQIDEGADGIIGKLQRSWKKIEFEEVREQLLDEYTILMKMLKER